jgi:hypothetical protein
MNIEARDKYTKKFIDLIKNFIKHEIGSIRTGDYETIEYELKKLLHYMCVNYDVAFLDFPDKDDDRTIDYAVECDNIRLVLSIILSTSRFSIDDIETHVFSN